MTEEIVKSESTAEDVATTKQPAPKPKKPRAKKAVEKPTVEEAVKTECKSTPEETPNVDTKNEQECDNTSELFIPAMVYDFRLSGEERKALLEEVKADALELKKEIIGSKFNTLSLKQIGKNKRMFALRHGNDVRIYINATIAGRAGGAVVQQVEECDPDTKYIILRPQQIRLVFINEVGEAKETVLEGIAAAEAVKQVEREEGILISELGRECPRWDKMTEPSRLRFVKAYLEDLSKIPTEPTSEEQKKYVEKKEAIKKELKMAKRIQGKAERERSRAIAKLGQSREKKPWED